jgi:hypothetical protein
MEISVLETKRMEQAVFKAELSWKMTSLPRWQDVSQDGPVISSGLFALNFDEVNETYQFELKITRPEENTRVFYIEVVNKNKFRVRIKSTLIFVLVNSTCLRCREETNIQDMGEDGIVAGYLNSEETIRFVATPANRPTWYVHNQGPVS